jgi:hypothetical protein
MAFLKTLASKHGVNAMRLVLSIGVCAGPAGCIAGSARGYALYATEGGRPGLDEVARLGGYVRYVDGQDVSGHGGPFELLPGCHVIGTPSEWGSINGAATAAVMAKTGKWMFALPMRADYYYSVDVEVPPMTGPTAPLSIHAHEKDASGKTTRTFASATSAQDLESCGREG